MNTVKTMMRCCTGRLALSAVLLLLTGGARGIRVGKEGPQVEPDGRQYKAAGFRSEHRVQPPAVSVHCTENSMVVRARADLYGTGRLVTASELRLGPDFSEGNCRAFRREDTELVITVGLHECGAELRVENDSLIYANTLFHIPTLNRFGIVRSTGVAFPLECRYKRTHFVSSNSRLIPESHTPTTPVLNFGTDDSISDGSMLDSGEVLSMVASVLSTRHSALKLFLDRCSVTLGPDTAATPSCDLINHHGCRVDSGSAEPTISWADGHVLRLKLNPLQSLGDGRHLDSLMFITCWMKTVDPVEEKNSLNKVCSYMGNSWHSVDGKHDVCKCCDRTCDVFNQRRPST